MRKLLCLAFLFLSALGFSQTATVTGHTVMGTGATSSSGISILFELTNDNGQQCKVGGIGLITPMSFTVTPAQLAAGISIYQNSSITCGTTTGATRWRYTLKSASDSGTRSCSINVTGATNLDTTQCLNAIATPTTTVPAASLYWLLDGSNFPTGNFIPAANGTQALGSSALRWNMFANTANITNLTVTGTCTGCGGGGGTGTVTSFSSGNLSPLFTTSVATTTTTPAQTFALSNAAAHTFLGNTSGISAAPSYSTITAADLPGVFAQTLSNVSHKWLNSYDAATGLFTQTQPAYSDLTGTPQLAITKTAVTSNWLRSYDSTTGLFTASQPAYTDITGTPQLAVTKTAVASNWLRSYDSTTGLFTASQPAYSDISGTVPAVTSVATTAPITGGTITTTGTIACATCVTASAPGAGIAHFAGSTQAVTSSAVAIGDVASSTGTGNFVFDTGASVRLKTLNGGIMFSDEFGLGNWCDDVAAADTLLGTKGGEIWITTLDGVFCSGPITVHNTLRFIDPGDYVTKGITIPVGGISIICNGLTNSGSSPFGTRLLYNGVGGQTVDGISILGTSIARLDKVNIEGCLFDGQQIDRYDLRVEKADGMTIKDSRFQGGGIANTYMVDAIDWKWYNVGSTFCQGPTGTAKCNIFDWGSGNGAWIGGQTEQGAASTGAQVVVSGAVNNIEFIAQDWDATFATGGFLLVQGQDANSAFPGAPTGGTGRPINITLRDSLISTTVNPAQGADILVTDATAAQQPVNVTISNVEFNGNSASAVAVKADQSQNVKMKDSFSNGHTNGTFWATSNALHPRMDDVVSLDPVRVVGTITSICDTWSTTGIENTNCNVAFNQPANKTGQADTVADSGALNTTETIVVKTPALAANRLIAGTHIRMTLTGTCTSTVANTSTFTIRMGTLGTTSDTAIATPVTAVAATTGTNIPFEAIIDFTVRTVGASATGFITLTLLNNGITGIAAQTTQIIMPTMSTFNTTTAANILSVSYKSAATTTTSTFKQGVIEIIQN